MAERKDQPTLRLIEGGAAVGALAAALVAASTRGTQAQLGLPGVSPPRRALICATVGVLAALGLDVLLREQLRRRQERGLCAASCNLRAGHHRHGRLSATHVALKQTPHRRLPR